MSLGRHSRRGLSWVVRELARAAVSVGRRLPRNEISGGGIACMVGTRDRIRFRPLVAPSAHDAEDPAGRRAALSKGIRSDVEILWKLVPERVRRRPAKECRTLPLVRAFTLEEAQPPCLSSYRTFASPFAASPSARPPACCWSTTLALGLAANARDLQRARRAGAARLRFPEPGAAGAGPRDVAGLRRHRPVERGPGEPARLAGADRRTCSTTWSGSSGGTPACAAARPPSVSRATGSGPASSRRWASPRRRDAASWKRRRARSGPPRSCSATRSGSGRFGGEPLVGQTLTIDGEPFVVIGIAPPGFQFPEGAEVWAPLRAARRGRGAAATSTT